MATMQSSRAADRSDYAKTLETQLASWKKEIAGLREQAKSAATKVTDHASTDVHSTLEALKQREEGVEKQLAALKAASDDAWETMKVGFDIAWADLKSAGKEAATKLESWKQASPA